MDLVFADFLMTVGEERIANWGPAIDGQASASTVYGVSSNMRLRSSRLSRSVLSLLLY